MKLVVVERFKAILEITLKQSRVFVDEEKLSTKRPKEEGMEGAKKKQLDETVNAKIQRKFDLVFGSASDADDFSDQEFGNEVSSMSESAKKELSPPNDDLGIALDFGDDGGDSLNFQSAAEVASQTKEATGKLSIVADDSDFELNLEFGNDASEIPDIPSSEEVSSNPPLKLETTAEDEDYVLEPKASPAPQASLAAAASGEGASLYDSLFDVEIEMASAKAVTEETQATVIYEKSATGLGLDALKTEGPTDNEDDLFTDFTGSMNSSAGPMSTEEDKDNIEEISPEMISAGQDLVSSDKTQEIELSRSKNESDETFFHEQSSPSTDINFSLESKLDPSGSFDMTGIGFSNLDQEMASPPLASDKEIETPSPREALLPSNNGTEIGSVSLSEDSSRFQGTIRQLREEREQLLLEIKMLKSQSRELEQDNLTLKVSLDEAKIEMSIIRKRHLTEMEDMKYRVAIAEERRSLAEEKAKNTEAKKEKLEQRVRIDFNQVKQREKELETKLEMLTIDIDSQVHSRDQKILELRRKIDALEFNMENVSIRELKSQDDKRKLEDKLNKIMKTLRHSIKNLEDDIDLVTEDAESDKDDKIKTRVR